MRSKDRAPTPVNFKRYLKRIALSQHIRRVKSGSYDQDDDNAHYLSGLTDLKEYHRLKLLEREEAEENLEIPIDNTGATTEQSDDELDRAFFDESNPYELNLAEKCSLIHFGGYVLKKTILTKSKCVKCISYFVTNEISKNVTHTIINERDYVAGALTRPSETACEMFEAAEETFRKYVKNWHKDENCATKLSTTIILKLVSLIEDVDQCHLKIIIDRFVRARLHFWNDYENRRLKPMNVENIKSAANASKSSKGKALFSGALLVLPNPTSNVHEETYSERKNTSKSDVITPQEVVTISKELDVPMVTASEQNNDSDSSIDISDDEQLVLQDTDGEDLFLNRRNQFDDYSSDEEIVPTTSTGP